MDSIKSECGFLYIKILYFLSHFRPKKRLETNFLFLDESIIIYLVIIVKIDYLVSKITIFRLFIDVTE